MKTLVVGDVTEHLSSFARTLDYNAKLITSDTINQFTNGVFFTSLGDLTDLSQFVEVLSLADKIVYCEPKHWSDTNRDKFSYMKKWTEFYLLYFSYRKQVSGLDNISKDAQVDFLNLSANRVSDEPQLWNAGCSITYGVGVHEHERYGELLAKRINMPVSILACTGSSIEWAADQILRSDLREGDILVWGLTAINRLPYYQDGKLAHINVSNVNEFPKLIDELTSDNRVYHSLTKIFAVINFCKKLKVKILILGLLSSPEDLPHLLTVPNFVPLYGYFGIDKNTMFMDRGTDNLHPGPLTHQWYADTISDILRCRND